MSDMPSELLVVELWPTNESPYIFSIINVMNLVSVATMLGTNYGNNYLQLPKISSKTRKLKSSRWQLLASKVKKVKINKTCLFYLLFVTRFGADTSQS